MLCAAAIRRLTGDVAVDNFQLEPSAVGTRTTLADTSRTEARGLREARTLAAGTAALVTLAYAVLALDDGRVEAIFASEHGVIENAGAASLLAASALFASTWWRARRAADLALAVVLFVGAGEELAWGQHLLGFSAPGVIEEWNAQDEVTLHNLDPLQDIRYAVGFDVAFAAASLLVLAYLLLVPAVAHRSPARRQAIERWAAVPPFAFGIVLLYGFALYAVVGVGTTDARAHAVTEVAEAGLALVLAAVALHAWLATRRAFQARSALRPGSH